MTGNHTSNNATSGQSCRTNAVCVRVGKMKTVERQSGKNENKGERVPAGSTVPVAAVPLFLSCRSLFSGRNEKKTFDWEKLKDR